MIDKTQFVGFLKQEAKALGFDAIGITKPEGLQRAGQHLENFVEQGRHGSMTWMAETLERRRDPRHLWDETKSIIVLALNYGPESNPLLRLQEVDKGNVSVYARHRDYHDIIKGRLKTLAAKMVSRAGKQNMTCDVKVFVDTAPVMEKPLAQKGGLGWQGKHTNLVSKEFGSWLFLGSIFTTLDLPEDQSVVDHCGSCDRCLSICPTKAFPAPYQLDARRCISYLTIENKGPIPLEFRKQMGNRIYGCDDCLSVCPWNKFAKQTNEIKFSCVDKGLPPLKALLQLDDAGFRRYFSGSPVKRIGRNRFIRNCLIAAGNGQDKDLISFVQPLLFDADPIIKETAGWALSELEKNK